MRSCLEHQNQHYVLKKKEMIEISGSNANSYYEVLCAKKFRRGGAQRPKIVVSNDF